MAWRNCAASMTLLAEVNARWPGRDRSSDGTIGDAAHATRTSDHNPWVVVDKVGVVRARDIDKDGIDAPWLAEFLRRRGQVGDPRLAGGGYVIFNRRITTPDFSGWKTYTGSNPHTAHLHVSFSRNRAGFDSTARWGITDPTPAPRPAPTQEDPLMALSDAEQRELLDTTRKLAGWLSMPSFTPPGEDPKKPWSVTPGHAILNTYVGMFYGGPSTANRSLFQAVADDTVDAPDGPPQLTAADHDAIARRVLALLTEHPLTPKGTPS